jgi:hypothetical protein
MLIIPGCCKKMVYQYVVVAKNEVKNLGRCRVLNPGAFILEVRYHNHYAIDDYDFHRVKLNPI